jgi:tetratricopeptide (TPR) repeat protein
MVKRMLFVVLIATLFFSFAMSVSAQEKKEIPKKVAKLVEKAGEDIKEKKFEKAAEKLMEAETLAPDYAPIYLHLSIMNQMQQKTEEALALMTKAYEMAPENDAIVNSYATLLLKIAQQKIHQDMPATLVLYEKFVAIPGIKSKMTPQYVQVTYTLAGSALQSNQPDRVIKYAEEMMTTPAIETYQQQHLFGYFLLGSAYGQKKDEAKSVENLKKFLELNHDNLAPAQFVSLANFLIASSLFDRMEAQIKSLKPEDLDGIKNVAQGQSEMLTYLNAALAADPQNQEAKFSLATHSYYCLNFDAAIAMLNELLVAAPANEDYKKSLDIITKARDAGKKK